MPVIVQQTINFPSEMFNTTAEDIIEAVSSDVLQEMGPDHPGLLDYVDRIHKQLLRHSRWPWLRSSPQTLVTVNNVSDYWIGAMLSGPIGTTETGLNITDLWAIDTSSVYDRTNFRRLGRTEDQPLGDIFDRTSKPRVWRNDRRNPYVLSIYPLPDQGILTNIVSISRASNIVTVVTSTPHQLSQNNYVSISGVTETSFNGAFSVFGSLGGGIISSTTFSFFQAGPNVSSSGGTVQGGYGIEFHYFQKRTEIISSSQVLQIPDDYSDVVTAGVNWLATKYLKSAEEANFWKQAYEEGKVAMIKDRNIGPRRDWIRPDEATIMQQTVTGIGLDSGIETSIP